MIPPKYNNYLNQGVSLHIIVLTLRCNLSCKYCDVTSVNPKFKKYDLTKPKAKKIIELIFQSPARDITIEFQGGEPTLNWDVLKYCVEYAEDLNRFHNKNIEFLLVTNLNNMDQEKREFLIYHNVSICTSLDGPKGLHDHNRPAFGGAGSYDPLIKQLKEFRKVYRERGLNNSISALLTVTKESLKDPLGIIDAYVDNGFTDIHIRPLTRLGCAAADWDKIGYSPEEYIDFLKVALDYIIELNKKGVQIQERLLTIMLRRIKGEYTNYMDLRVPCGAVIGQLAYNYDGNIYACDEARFTNNEAFKIGTIENNYSEIVTSPKSCKIIEASINEEVSPCKSCNYQEYCGLCPVCTHAEQGDFIGDISKTPRCKINMFMFNYILSKYFSDIQTKKILDGWLLW